MGRAKIKRSNVVPAGPVRDAVLGSPRFWNHVSFFKGQKRRSVSHSSKDEVHTGNIRLGRRWEDFRAASLNSP
jgi:hypothetical protein